MVRKEQKTGPGQPEEAKPATLLDVVSRFNREGMACVEIITKNPFLRQGHQAMLSLATRELLESVTAPHTFLLKPDEQKSLEDQLKEAVGITGLRAGVSRDSGFIKTTKDSDRLLVAANYVNSLAGTEPKVHPGSNR